MPAMTHEELDDATKPNCCPKCEADFHVIVLQLPETVEFKCGTKTQAGKVHQSDKCRIAELTAALQKAEREREEAVKALDENWVTHQQLIAGRNKLAAAEAERDAMRANLLKYGDHTQACNMDWELQPYNAPRKCVCGLDEIKAALAGTDADIKKETNG